MYVYVWYYANIILSIMNRSRRVARPRPWHYGGSMEDRVWRSVRSLL